MLFHYLSISGKGVKSFFCLLLSLHHFRNGFLFYVIPMKMGIQYWYYQKKWIPRIMCGAGTAGVYPVLDTGQE